MEFYTLMYHWFINCHQDQKKKEQEAIGAPVKRNFWASHHCRANSTASNAQATLLASTALEKTHVVWWIKKSSKKYFFKFSFGCLTWGLNRHLTSNTLTRQWRLLLTKIIFISNWFPILMLFGKKKELTRFVTLC